jgi:hypothetical protein
MKKNSNRHFSQNLNVLKTKLSALTIIFALTCLSSAFAQSTNNEPRDPKAPENTVKIPGMELYVNSKDEPSRMPLDVAKSVCACKGEGWRLPTIGELQTIYQYKGMFGNFSREYYWSMDQKSYSERFYNLNFKNGRIDDEDNDEDNKVRCIWSPKKAE